MKVTHIRFFGTVILFTFFYCADASGKTSYIEGLEKDRYTLTIQQSYQSGNRVNLTDQNGTLRQVALTDINGDGQADGIDLDGDGNLDIRILAGVETQISPWAFIVPIDIDNDGAADYFLYFQTIDSAIQIRFLMTGSADAPQLIFVVNGSNQITGLDVTGDGVADDVRLAGILIISGAATAPTYSPVSGSYSTAQNITISSSTPGATICYTTDGVTTPACDIAAACTVGNTYVTAVNTTITTYFQAIACHIGNAASSVTNGNFFIGNTWTTRPVTPTVRSYAAAAEVNGKIYVLGGLVSGVATAINEVFDPGMNSWLSLAAMPTPRTTLGAAAENGTIYAIGGDSSGSVSTVEAYDPISNTWSTKASLSAPRANLSAVSCAGKIYAIGGAAGVGGSTTNEEYDPNTNTWMTRAAMPTSRTRLAVACVNGKVYAYGGHATLASTTAFTNLQEYDPATNLWTAKTAMPTGRYAFAGTSLNNKIYASGGNIGFTEVATIDEYDPNTDSWLNLASMPAARCCHALVGATNKLYAIGGQLAGPNVTTVYEFTPPVP